MVLLGPPGAGRAHLAVSRAVAAAEWDRRVCYGTPSGLVASLEGAEASALLEQRLKVLTHPALLVVDEVGYPPVRPGGAAP